jgi:membrane protein DedA with SNARE-associated domain
VNVAVAMFVATLSTTFLPVPEEAALMGAGYAARMASLPVAYAVAPAWLAVIAGDTVAYVVGRTLSERARSSAPVSSRVRLDRRSAARSTSSSWRSSSLRFFEPVLVRMFLAPPLP